MVNISVPFPEPLREQAEAAARERGLSLDEFVRESVTIAVGKSRSSDPLFGNVEVFTGDAPSDLSENHDHYLYGADS